MLSERAQAWLQSAQECPDVPWRMDIRGLTSGIAREMLRHGLIERVPDAAPSRYQMSVYRLTEAGRRSRPAPCGAEEKPKDRHE